MSLQSIFDRVIGVRDEIQGAIVVSQDGTALCTRGSQGLATAATALVVPLRDVLERAAAELGGGRLVATMIEAETGRFCIADIDGVATVVVVAGADSSPGLVRHEALTLATALRGAR
jgi:predicted regulator of Ras-like GTPase activity (Roadblock/LC7/MglB family)